MGRSRLTIGILVSGGLGLAGCAWDPAQSPAWELAGQPGLLLEVKHHYERRATEENGLCTSPIMEGVTRSEVLEEDDQHLRVWLAYYYRDYLRDGDDCSERRPLRCGVMRECRGFGERTFTIDKGQGGLAVVEMSGPQRGQRQ
jgi:hypothetical protein